MIDYDGLVIGGGNAGLCAAISARRAGATVLVLEAASRFYRGGNTRHTRNMRCAHDRATSTLTGSYPESEYFDDLMRVTEGCTDQDLARFMVAESSTVLHWLEQQGVRCQPPFAGTLSLGRTNSFFLGGGRAMLNALYRTAEAIGVEIAYDAEVTALNVRNGTFHGATVGRGDDAKTIVAGAVVAAAGGFEANIEWLRESWGEAANNFIVRGTPHNRGTILRMLLKAGAGEVGDPSQCHAVAVDARAPKFDGGIITRLDCVIFGIVVNILGERFYDEGEDFWPKRYAVWGRLVAAQPEQLAFIIFDAKALNLFMPSLYPPISAVSIEGLAVQLGLPPAKLRETVDAFNAAVRPGNFDPSVLDNCSTDQLSPPKSHWARRIAEAPFYAYPVRPGITFTYLATRVDQDARIIMADGNPAANIFAAGEIMAGNILGRGYAAGAGMTIGSVFGRVAGQQAARISKG